MSVFVICEPSLKSWNKLEILAIPNHIRWSAISFKTNSQQSVSDFEHLSIRIRVEVWIYFSISLNPKSPSLIFIWNHRKTNCIRFRSSVAFTFSNLLNFIYHSSLPIFEFLHWIVFLVLFNDKESNCHISLFLFSV